MRFSSRKPHGVDQRHGSQREIWGSVVEGPAVSFAGTHSLNYVFPVTDKNGRSIRTPASHLRLRLEVYPQCELPCPITGILCRLRSCEVTEGRRIVDLGRRRQAVGVVKNVGESRFEAHVHPFRDGEDLSQAKAD